jgi:hypothetical protein
MQALIYDERTQTSQHLQLDAALLEFQLVGSMNLVFAVLEQREAPERAVNVVPRRQRNRNALATINGFNTRLYLLATSCILELRFDGYRCVDFECWLGCDTDGAFACGARTDRERQLKADGHTKAGRELDLAFSSETRSKFRVEDKVCELLGREIVSEFGVFELDIGTYSIISRHIHDCYSRIVHLRAWMFPLILTPKSKCVPTERMGPMVAKLIVNGESGIS